MGRLENNISFSKRRSTLVPTGSSAVGHRYSQIGSPPLVAGLQLRYNATDPPNDDFRAHYSQSRDAISPFGVNSDSSLRNSGLRAHAPDGVLNANFAIENPWLSQGLRNSGLPAYAPDGNANFATENPLFSQEYTTFQAFNDIPTIVAPSYNTDAQRYTGDARYITELCDANPPSCPSTRSSDSYRSLYVGLPTEVSGGIPGTYIAIGNTVPPLQNTAFQASSNTHTSMPPYGSHTIAQSYEDDTSNFDNLGHFSFDHSPYSLTPQYPSSSVSSTPVSMSETHPNTHHPTPPMGHNYQAMVPSEQGGQQPGTPRIFNIDGCCIDGYDLADQGAVNGRIIVGQCFRTDSPCGLWVKADKRSIKRHAQRWHGISRGGEGSRASCTWAGCNTVLQKSAIPRHTLRQHYGERFKCEGCSRCFTRLYCWKNHAKKCASSSEGCTVRYDDGTHTINVTMYFSDDGS